jgi:hypothetical protein
MVPKNKTQKENRKNYKERKSDKDTLRRERKTDNVERKEIWRERMKDRTTVTKQPGLQCNKANYLKLANYQL